jgi:Pvc16 N-terminal domain
MVFNMIADALIFVTNQLDSFLKRKTSGTKSVVKLSGLVTPDGTISVTEDNVLVLTVVNIEEENSIANQPNFARQGSTILKQTPPVYINVYILISALFNENQYAVGLHWLSLAINFFQQHPYFNSEQIAMPIGIDKLSFELVNLDADSMSKFWGALGARYQPSVVYKVRMLKISSETMEAILPEILDPKVTIK